MLNKTLVSLIALVAIGCSGNKDGNNGSDTSVTTDTQTVDTQTTDATCTTDVCAVYGPAVPTVSGQITDQAAADPEFADAFADLVAKGPDEVQKFKDSLAAYISDTFGCTTGTYTGPSMVDAHTGMNITQQQYDDFVTLIAGILTADGVSEHDVNYCFAPPLVDPDFEAEFIGL